MYKWVLATKSSGDITLRWTRILSSRVAIFLGASCYMYLNIIVIITMIIISFVIIIVLFIIIFIIITIFSSPYFHLW